MPSSAAALTDRQHEVLSLLQSGMQDKEIANKLNISFRTVRFHISNLFAIYGVSNRAELIVHSIMPVATPMEISGNIKE